MSRSTKILFNLATLVSLFMAFFELVFGGAAGTNKQADTGLTENPFIEHPLGMHGHDAPVQNKKATTTEQSTTEQGASNQSVSDNSTSGQSTTEQASVSSASGFEYSGTGNLLEEVNSLRTFYGLSPLAGDSLLDAAAATRAAELTVCMSHTRPDGRPASSIVTDYGIPCSYRGENIAAGYALSSSVLAGWEESPSHLENLLNPVFTRAGISHTVTSTGYLDYWVILLSD